MAEKKKATKKGKSTGKSANKNKGGRPTVMTAEVVGKLELGFLKDLNITQCCHFAGISRQTFYEYCDKHPEFLDKIEELQSSPSMKAKVNIVDAIEAGDLELSKWWLERKSKDEFSLKQDISVSTTQKNPMEELTTDELRKLIYDG